MSTVIVIVQARVGSTRLPGKVLREICGVPMLLRVVERARAIPGTDRVVVATTTEPADAQLVKLARDARVEAYAGSETDVLDRYYQAARHFGADAVVRVTADCPLLDPSVSASVLARFLDGGVDYVTNSHPPTFPDGLDTEVIGFSALERAWHEATRPSDREHVTPYLWRQPSVFRNACVSNPTNLSGLRWTVDDELDLKFVRDVYSRLLPAYGGTFGMSTVQELLEREPNLAVVNRGTLRNEGYAESRGRDPNGAT
jgi:spore coat polysaccharide biosynthesis protein SpsF